MSISTEASAAQLRRQLADQLKSTGDLRSTAWRRALERVPREVFLGEAVYQTASPDETLWKRVTAKDLGEIRWLELAYENTSWVTQLDGHDQDGTGPLPGIPTSSSTLPGLVVRMLEDLDVRDGHRVLEVGTGTGYSTALLCQRLGGDQITSIEVDAGIAGRAAAALASAGYAPRLIIGDGLDGHPAGAPYDRIIATCSVRTIPDAWIAQATPSGRIIATISGWLYGSGLVALDVTGDGQARGRYLPGTISFMPARAHTPPPITWFPARKGEQRVAAYGPRILNGWMGRFLAELATPGAQHVRLGGDADTPPSDLLLDQATGAYAWLTENPDGTWTTIQGGPARLWDQIEQTQTAWRQSGEPPQHEFTVAVTPEAKTVRLDTPGGPHTWTLPVG